MSRRRARKRCRRCGKVCLRDHAAATWFARRWAVRRRADGWPVVPVFSYPCGGIPGAALHLTRRRTYMGHPNAPIDLDGI